MYPQIIDFKPRRYYIDNTQEHDEMTIPDAIVWIENLIHTMKEETSGKCPDPAYKEEVYAALHMAIRALVKEGEKTESEAEK